MLRFFLYKVLVSLFKQPPPLFTQFAKHKGHGNGGKGLQHVCSMGLDVTEPGC